MQSNTILVVEDNDDDFEACQVGLSINNNLVNPLIRCETGQEALDYLLGEGLYAPPNRPPLPGLILLDLNLPGIDGREVLARIKSNPELRKIAVVVMTTSRSDIDVKECYDAGANSYVVKPVDIQKFFEAIARLKEYWFELVLLPENQ
ncbi:MAG: response regulator [Magnetospiraceae bacterium]